MNTTLLSPYKYTSRPEEPLGELLNWFYRIDVIQEGGSKHKTTEDLWAIYKIEDMFEEVLRCNMAGKIAPYEMNTIWILYRQNAYDTAEKDRNERMIMHDQCLLQGKDPELMASNHTRAFYEAPVYKIQRITQRRWEDIAEEIKGSCIRPVYIIFEQHPESKVANLLISNITNGVITQITSIKDLYEKVTEKYETHFSEYHRKFIGIDSGDIDVPE